MECKLTQKEKLFSFLRKMFFLTLGPCIAAFALEVFLVPNNIIDGGIVGVSIILSYLTKINLGLCNPNILCHRYVVIGGKFFDNSSSSCNT